MRVSMTILCLFFTICSFAQTSTGNIERDTALANQYFAEATELAKEKSGNKEVIILLEKAIALYEIHPFDEKLIMIKIDLFNQYYRQFNLEASATVAEDIVNLVKGKAPHLITAPVLSKIYQILYLSDSSVSGKESVEYALLALACNEKGSPEYFKIAGDLVLQYMDYSKIDEAEALLKDLEHFLNEQNNDKLDRYWLVIYRGKIRLFQEYEDYEQALLYSKKLLAENEKYFVYGNGQIAPLYMSMALFLTHLDEYEEALEWANKSLSMAKHVPSKSITATFYCAFGSICGIQEKYRKAIENYELGITYFLEDEERSSGRLQSAYQNVAGLYLKLEEYDKAMIYIEKSKTYGLHPAQGNVLGEILRALGQYEDALKELQTSIIQYSKEFKSEDINENPSIYEIFEIPLMASDALGIKGKTWYDWGKAEKDKIKLLNSYKALKVAFSHKESFVKTNRGFEKTMFKLNSDLLRVLDIMIRVQVELYQLEPEEETFNELLYLTERRKAFQLIETLSPSYLPNDIIRKEQDLLRELNNHGHKLDLATHNGHKDSILFYQNALFETNQILEEHLEMIRNNYPKESSGFYNTEYAQLNETKAELPGNTLLIEYNIIGNDGFIIAISSSNEKIVPVNFENLGDNIKKLSELIQDRFAFQTSVRKEFIDVSHELYKTLIEPITSELEGKTKLMIVLEGQLFHLPFELLLKNNEKKPYHDLDFLLKDYEVNYHYSVTAYSKLKEKPTIQDYSLLAFAPVFSKGKELTEATRSLNFMIDSLYRSIDNNGFVGLPNTKKEVNEIAKIIQSNNGQANILLNKNATKANLSNELESQPYQFIHIATHGLVNFKKPKLSALACYSKNATMDNLIYANEIQFKDINADLVVLSSCESGIGQLVEGEGLLALNRSFIYSGAKNVLFSLWKVNDKYSSELMINFYENYFQDQSYTAALRNAKLKLLENPITAEPKFWAAFVLMGE